MNTIAAISTATGNSGIGIIRMSGENCFEILNKFFRNKEKKVIDNVKGYNIKYGYIINEKNEIIDEVLVSYFIAPRSYTMENMCEINSHGGFIVEKMILEQCLKNGADLAEPGEFTKRAFLNGRIDLSQAESVIDLINSKTEKEAKASINQLSGKLSLKINGIKDDILDIMSDIEATIDYPEYDIEEVTNKNALEKLYSIKNKMEKLEGSFNTGKLLKEGIKTIIIGKPNAGKSSLLNLILNEDRAIVSEYAGTTRDTIEEFVNIKGIPLKLIDTAGIRKTENIIEEIGVNRALNLVSEADLILALFDSSKELEKEDFDILKLIENKNAIVILNKIDLEKNILDEAKLKNTNKVIIKISAKNGTGIEDLYDEIVRMFEIDEVEINNCEIITNVRHKNQIRKAIDSIDNSISSLNNNMPIDIISINIREILSNLGEITGENVTDDIINKIFSKFCLGK